MKILFPNNIFEKSFYCVAKSTNIVDISLDVGVPPHFLIRDNDLTKEPEIGDVLIVVNRGEISVLDSEIMQKISVGEKERIKRLNGLTYLFCGQIVLI